MPTPTPAPPATAPAASDIAAAVRRAFATTLQELPKDHAERSQEWVEHLAHGLGALLPGANRRLLHKQWGHEKSGFAHGEFLVDVAIVEVASIRGVMALAAGLAEKDHQPEYARRLLLAAESEFEPDTRSWLDDLSKLVVVDAPVRVFVASRAGAGQRPDLEKAQLQLFAEVLRDVYCERFVLALLPHPKVWEPGLPAGVVSTYVLGEGGWSPC